MSNGPLGDKELKTLARIGDILIPGDDAFPSFSDSGCIKHVNVVAAEADPADIGDLAMFLKILAVMPTVVLRMLLALINNADSFPEPLAIPLRQLNIALRGMIISPYFANLANDIEGEDTYKDPHKVMGFSLKRIED